VAVEAEEQDPLPLPQAEPAALERDLLRPRAEDGEEQPLPVAHRAGQDPLQQRLDVAEEAGLALADADGRVRHRGGDVGDPALDARGAHVTRDLVRDVEHREGRERGGNGVRNADLGHRAATSRGSRKWTSSRATVTSSTSP